MSCVTNIILITSCSDSEDDLRPATADAVNAILEGMGHQPLVKADEHWRGGKGIEANVHIGAFNYFQLTEFISKICLIDWIAPEDAQLLYSEHEDCRFSMATIEELRKAHT